MITIESLIRMQEERKLGAPPKVLDRKDCPALDAVLTDVENAVPKAIIPYEEPSLDFGEQS